MKYVLMAIMASFATAGAASAQVLPIGPTANQLKVTFTGTVTNNVTDSITIRQPDGTSIPYTGPVPDYPYQKGDQVAISFVTTVPNKAYYESAQYTGQVAADGIYRINVTSPASGTPGSAGFTPTLDVSGPAGVEGTGGPMWLRGLTIVYDANKDSYSLDMGSTGWQALPITMPSYTYDPVSGALVSRPNACFSVQCEESGILIRGTADSVSIGDGFGRGIAIGSATEPTTIGWMSALNLSGLFNFAMWNGGSTGGGSTDVPAPGMMILFGAGAMALLQRRRRQRARA